MLKPGRRALGQAVVACAVLLAGPAVAAAVGIRIDYTQDQSGFFSAATASGRAARAAVEQAADFYSQILVDSLAPVSTPEQFQGLGGGTADFFLEFLDPNLPFDSHQAVQLRDYSIAQDEYVVFVGGAAMPGSQIASAGLGGSGFEYALFFPAEYFQIQSIHEQFVDDYRTRGQAGGFAHWGGTISFDNDGSTAWNLDPGTTPSAAQSDLYSTALHELGHVLGFGSTTLAEQGLVNGAGQFVGQHAELEYGGPVPMHAGGGHWAEGVASVSVDSGTPQEALFDPSFNGSAVKDLTTLDAAGLRDLGWSVSLGGAVQGDFNGDLVVDAADYTVWRDGLGVLFGAEDYLDWRDAYGASPSARPVAAAPAPGAGWLGLAVLASAPSRRRPISSCG